MDDRTALLVPGRRFDSWSYMLVPKLLDRMPSGMRACFNGVINRVGPDNGRFEDPTIGKGPA